MIYQIKDIHGERKRVNVVWADMSDADFLTISPFFYGSSEQYNHIYTDSTNGDLVPVLNPCQISVWTKMLSGSFLSTNVKFAHLKHTATIQTLQNFVISVWYASFFNTVVANHFSIRGRKNGS